MRRRDREITDHKKIEEILGACQVVSVAFAGETPYVIPMSYGFVVRDGRFTLYMHGAHEGEKIERIKANPTAAFSMYTGERIYGKGDGACTYSTSFDSVCGKGEFRFAEGEEKTLGLAAIMAHYAPGREFTFDARVLEHTMAAEITVTKITGKHHD